MFEKLQQKWHVNGWNLLLILCTFALGGSLCGWAGRKVLLLTGLEKGVLWVICYVILVTLLWPLCVLLISIPLGQFRFFKSYIAKIAAKMSGRRAKKAGKKTNIAIFASGAGSNAAKIIAASGEHNYNIALVVHNKPGVGVIDIAKKANVATLLIERDRFFHGDHYLPELKQHHIDMIVLAGFLWKMPPALVKAFPKKIVNIHPALLPMYGGKGMYGNHVHNAVIAAGEKQSGISIHYVDEVYDNGEIIFQATCPVNEYDTPETLAQKIHALEHEHYPKVLGGLVKK